VPPFSNVQARERIVVIEDKPEAAIEYVLACVAA